jgi:ABC-type glutathione transport system ATPase component
MARTILELKAQGIGILLSEQNLPFAEVVADRAYVLEKGQIVHAASMAELAATRRHASNIWASESLVQRVDSKGVSARSRMSAAAARQQITAAQNRQFHLGKYHLEIRSALQPGLPDQRGAIDALARTLQLKRLALLRHGPGHGPLTRAGVCRDLIQAIGLSALNAQKKSSESSTTASGWPSRSDGVACSTCQ